MTSQCVNGNSFTFGCVSPSQLSAKIKIRDNSVGNYDFFGATIILYSYFGKIPPENNGKRGVFNVTSATKNNDIFTISAVDNICFLDKSAFEENENSLANSIYRRLGSGGSLWDAMSALGIIVGEFSGGISLKSYNDSQKRKIPNATAIFDGYGVPEIEDIPERRVFLLSDEESDNVRDYVSWLAEFMGGFIFANCNGEIEFKLFETPFYDTPEVLDFADFQQNSLEIANFRIFFYGTKIITENNDFCKNNFDKISENNVINFEIVIKNNPFVEFIKSRNSGEILYKIVGALMYYNHKIPVNPFSAIYHGKQYLHLGQYIKIKDKNGDEFDTVITNITWKFRGGQQIKCAGEDSRTISQAQKRSQAVRMGERMKTLINRIDSANSGNNSEINSKINSVENSISNLDEKINQNYSLLDERIHNDWVGNQNEISKLKNNVISLKTYDGEIFGKRIVAIGNFSANSEITTILNCTIIFSGNSQAIAEIFVGEIRQNFQPKITINEFSEMHFSIPVNLSETEKQIEIYVSATAEIADIQAFIVGQAINENAYEFPETADFIFEKNENYAILKSYTGENISPQIPDIFDGKIVKIIEKGAFGNSEIESVYIPDGVEEIR